MARKGTVDEFVRARRQLEEMLRRGASWSGNERNCCFLNTGQQQFATVSAVSGFDFLDDARALALIDWDFDGKLDVWAVNRSGPQIRFLRNYTQTDHHYLAVKLQGVTCNRDAIGARLELYLKDLPDQKIIKTLRAGEGFLAQSSKWIHFGLGKHDVVDRLVVRWPDGKAETIAGLAVDRRYEIVQGTGLALRWQAPWQPVPLAPSRLEAPEPTSAARLWMSPRVLMPIVRYTDLEGQPQRLDATSGPVLINLWASWCVPCQAELQEWAHHAKLLEQRGLKILALAVDGVQSGDSSNAESARKAARKMKLPFTTGLAGTELLDKIERLRARLFSIQESYPVPSSFLLDASGALTAIYVGPVDVDQLLEDLNHLKGDNQSDRAQAVPFPGRWYTKKDKISLLKLAKFFRENGYPEDAKRYECHAKPESAIIISERGTDLAESGRFIEAMAHFRKALELDPECAMAQCNIGVALHQQGRSHEALPYLQEAIRLDPKAADAYFSLGAILIGKGQTVEAIGHFEKAVSLRPDDVQAYINLAVGLNQAGRVADAVPHLRKVLELEPDRLVVARQLAWFLATHPDGKVRHAKEAVELAEKVTRATKCRVPIVLDTLAAAYANAGRYDEAVRVAGSAILLARALKQEELIKAIESRKKLYERGNPYRLDASD